MEQNLQNIQNHSELMGSLPLIPNVIRNGGFPKGSLASRVDESVDESTLAKRKVLKGFESFVINRKNNV